MVFTKKKMMENDNLFRGCEKVKGSTFKLLYDWISKRNLMHFMMGYITGALLALLMIWACIVWV